MATLQQWVGGARPRTLPAALAPVLVGTASAHALGSARLALAALALLVALALQVGVNYANDYSDGIRGTDEVRVGPVRLVGQRLASPRSVKLAAFGAFAVAGVAGLVLVAWSGTWWLLLAGAAAVAAAWLYTGGPRPYGYIGLGEVFVFVFFGLMAVLGTTYTQALRVDAGSWAGAVGIGSLACAVLMTNNIRDVPGDLESGKNTLAVRLGRRRAIAAYAVLLAIPFVAAAGIAVTSYPWAALTLVAVPYAAYLTARLRRAGTARTHIAVLAGTGMLELVYAVLLAIGLVLSA